MRLPCVLARYAPVPRVQENARMDMTSEMMGDAIDDALDDADAEDETDELVGQVSGLEHASMHMRVDMHALHIHMHLHMAMICCDYARTCLVRRGMLATFIKACMLICITSQ